MAALCLSANSVRALAPSSIFCWSALWSALGFTTALKARFAPFSVSSAPAALAASKNRLDCLGSSGTAFSLGRLAGLLEAFIWEFLPKHLYQVHWLNVE